MCSTENKLFRLLLSNNNSNITLAKTSIKDICLDSLITMIGKNTVSQQLEIWCCFGREKRITPKYLYSLKTLESPH